MSNEMLSKMAGGALNALPGAPVGLDSANLERAQVQVNKVANGYVVHVGPTWDVQPGAFHVAGSVDEVLGIVEGALNSAVKIPSEAALKRAALGADARGHDA